MARPETVGANKAVELITLGGVRLLQHGVQETSRLGPKHLALLVYLFHEQRPMQPVELAELLGRGREEEKELEAFGRIVQWIRKCVPSVNIRVTADTVEGIGGLRLDTTDVDAAIDRGDAEFVKSHYSGEFLEGFESGAAGFDEWAQRERGRIQRAWSQGILAAARRCENRGEWDDAAEWWGILAERSPMRPETTIGVIRTCAKAGRMEEAGRSYAKYLARLKESGIDQPAPAVKQLIGAFPDVLKYAAEWKGKLEQASPGDGSAVKPEAVPSGGRARGPSDSEAPAEGAHKRQAGDDDAGVPPIDIELGDLVDPAAMKRSPKPDAGEAEPAEDEDSAGVNPYLLEMWEQFSVSAKPQEAPSPSENGDALGAEVEPADARREGATPERGQPPRGRIEFMLPDGGTETVDDLEDSASPTPRRRRPDRELTNLARSTLEEEELRKIAHQVTSVRKPWGPFLRRVWDELEPWREYVASVSISAAVGVARLSVIVFRILVKAGAVAGRGSVRGMRALGFILAKSGLAALRLGAGGLVLLRAAGIGLLNGALFVPRRLVALSGRRRIARVERKAEREAERARVRAERLARQKEEREAERARGEAERLARQQAEREAERARAEAEKLGRREAELERQRQEAEQGRQRLEAERREREARLERKRDAPAEPARPAQPEWPVAKEPPVVGARRGEDRVDTDEEFLSLVSDPAEQEEPLVPLPDEFLDERELGGYTPDPSPRWGDAGRPRVVYPAAGDRASGERARGARRLGAGLAAFAALFKRRWFAPVGLGAGGLAVISALLFTGVIGGVEDELSSGLPDVRPPALPRVNLPKVSVPKVTIKTPDFVENPLSRIGELLSGPILGESGEWVVLADIEADADRAELASALTVALEADLGESRYFSLVPRERALKAFRRVGDSSSDGASGATGGLSRADALKLARSAGYAAVVTGRLIPGADGDSLSLRVLDPTGAERYGLSAELPKDGGALETLSGLARPVERRLGEPAVLIEASHAGAHLLSTSRDALIRYADARAYLFHGRYDQATRAARQAIAADSAFAMAYRTLAEAEALRGRRTAGRAALEKAWELSSRISEREQLRLLADRLAWDGLYTEAALTYDKLFKLYRDDAAALRGLAIVQRMIGARGGGEGNLRIAYELDPHDWPSLSVLARYLGYRGPLPDVDSLVTSLEDASEPASSGDD